MSRLAALVVCLTAVLARPAAAQVTAAYLIRTAADGTPVVETIRPDAFPPPPSTRGLLVWSDATGDRWLTLTKDDWQSRLPAAGKPAADHLGGDGFTRGGRGGATDSSLASLTRTHLVAPANLTGRTRWGEILTPVRGSATFSTSPVARRLPVGLWIKYPEAEATLKGLTGDAAGAERKFTFPAGSDRATLADLAPGTYTLDVVGTKSVQFTVESPARRAAVLGLADQLARTLGPDDPLVLLYTVEKLLATGQPRNGAPAYLGDALDRLEAVGEGKLSPYLCRAHARLLEQAKTLAAGEVVTPADPPADAEATGVPAVDAARAALLAGRYREAEAALAKVPANDARAARLATLYRAVLLAESGAGADAEAEVLFAQSAADAPPADRFRVHANFAQFLHRRAQDRLNNHAFQMAAGVARTVTAVAADWAAAREQYALAAKAGDARQVAELGLDLAGLYSLLGDLIRTLDPTPEAAPFVAAATAAADRAAADAANASDPIARGIAREVRAQLALRGNRYDDCRTAAEAARADYLAAGFLPGIENAHRLIGRAALDSGKRDAAARHLTASHLVAELLRDRLGTDPAGRTRAGFFARRAFVLDTLVELHLKNRNFDEALELAEQAKARAFTDMLDANGVTPARPAARPLSEVRKAWPKNTAAVEYFLARDRVWAFVVTTAGAVTAVELKTPAGDFVDPRDLVAKVPAVAGGMEGYAQKLANRLLNDQGYDNRWQDDLHVLGSILLPKPVLDELRKAEVVLLAPQHVLHYLPFAALVLEKDPKATAEQMARPPRLVIDEPFVMVNVPSVVGWDAMRRAKPPPRPWKVNAVGLVQAPGEARLEGVEKDLANLKAAFGDDLGTVLDRDEATPSRAAKLFGTRGLLLLATHGYNEADAPLESYLVLNPEGRSDGRLRAKDVYRARVAADVVVMSACYTGLGDRSPLPGDDLFGLQRAFLQAGGRAVIAGLWDVYDQTAPDLLRGCLDRLAKGVPAARALKEAQKEFLDRYRKESGPFAHPYFWAVYTVLGDDAAGVGR